jgi:toxin YoeB
MNIIFSEIAWEEYEYWQQHDRKLTLKINALLKDCRRSPFSGIGKPEPLKGNLAGWWSRRINDEHRFVYRVTELGLEVAQCRYHY